MVLCQVLRRRLVNPQDLATIQKIVQDALQNAEFINKVWIAGAAVLVSLFAAIVASLTQMLVARSQRKTQLKLAEQQTSEHKDALRDQLSMQELASRRIANASISAKRQVWIDELRKDVAKYLSIWQEISYRWDAVVNKPREGAISDEELAAFSQPIAQMRKEAHELQLLIELRLNMTEVNHQDLKALMNKLENTTLLYNRTVSQLPPKNIQTVFKVGLNEVVIKAQQILKEEWERVKKDSYADPNDHSHTK